MNEEDGILTFCKAIDSYAAALAFPLELVFVDDGSTDGTAERLRHYLFHNVRSVRLIMLSHNFGSHAALRAGITQASYDIVTWMSADLQEPLEMLPRSYEKIREGYDAVYIEKKSVGVSGVERGFSKVYSALMRKYAVKNYSSGGTSVIVFNKKIKDLLNRNIESNSSIMLQIIDAGFRFCTLSLDFGERKVGASKWTLAKKIKLFIDSFVSFSFMPIRLVSIIGIIVFAIGLLIGIVTIVGFLLHSGAPLGYSTLASMIALGFGITNISLGIIAEYLWRTYDAARGRPVFIISQVTELNDAEAKEDKLPE